MALQYNDRKKGDPGILLYSVRNGRPVSTGQPAKGTRLDFDGKTLCSLGVHHGVWEIDAEKFRASVPTPNGLMEIGPKH